MIVSSPGSTNVMVPTKVDDNLLDRSLFPGWPLATTEYYAATPRELGLSGLGQGSSHFLLALIILGLVWYFGRDKD